MCHLPFRFLWMKIKHIHRFRHAYPSMLTDPFLWSEIKLAGVVSHLGGPGSFRGWVPLAATHLNGNWAPKLCAFSDCEDWSMNLITRNNIIILSIKKISPAARSIWNGTSSAPAFWLPHSRLKMSPLFTSSLMCASCWYYILILQMHYLTLKSILGCKLLKTEIAYTRILELRENTSTLFLVCLNKC